MITKRLKLSITRVNFNIDVIIWQTVYLPCPWRFYERQKTPKTKLWLLQIIYTNPRTIDDLIQIQLHAIFNEVQFANGRKHDLNQ